MQGGLIQLAPMGADARSQAKVCRDCLRRSAGWRSGGDWGSVLQIVLAACGGTGEKCVVFEASWQPQERVQKPPDETDPRHTLLYEKKKKKGGCFLWVT